MDSRDKDEAKFHRQETLARRIGKALDEMDAHSAGHCPDAEILATYAEQRLGAEVTAKWESHFATCSRCRKVLLILNASAETPLAEREVARLGELAAVTGASAEAKGPGSALAWPGFRDWRLRWLAPALGVAAVLAVFVALRMNWRRAGEENPRVLVAQAPKEELPAPSAAMPATPPPASQVEPQRALGEPQADRPSFRDKSGSPPPKVTPGEPEKRKMGLSASPNSTSVVANDQAGSQASKKFGALQAGREIQPRSAVAPPTSAAGAEVAAPPPDVSLSPTKPAAPNTVAPNTVQPEAATDAAIASAPTAKQAVTAQARPAPNAAGGPPSARASAEAMTALRKEQAFALAVPVQAGPAIFKAPSSTTLWRAGLNGKIERSTDGGATWVQQTSPSQEDWLAGAAAADTVCWLVGRRGAIARTLDGDHWQSIAPPPQAAAQRGNFGDFTGVAAASAQAATITTSDGRKFMTSDGGKTWQDQPSK